MGLPREPQEAKFISRIIVFLHIKRGVVLVFYAHPCAGDRTPSSPRTHPHTVTNSSPASSSTSFAHVCAQTCWIYHDVTTNVFYAMVRQCWCMLCATCLAVVRVVPAGSSCA
eukprot:3253160-Pyramimonas_sp.AAC.3